MDCADAVLSRRDLETRRKILKDSHVGSFAVVALCVLFLIEFAALADGPMEERLRLLPFVCAIPRKEVDYLFDLDADTYAGLWDFAARVARAIRVAIPCKRVGVAVLGMEVPHAHIHLVPLRSPAPSPPPSTTKSYEATDYLAGGLCRAGSL